MSSPKKHRQSLIHSGLLLPALLAAAAWLGGAYIIERNIISPRSAAQVDEAARRQSGEYAAELGRYFSARNRQLDGVGRNGHTSVELRKNDALPQASAQFFTDGEIRVGAGKNPSLNFALVDLLKRSRSESPQAAEFLRTSADDGWQLHSAVARPGGLLLITQPFAAFEKVLKKFDSGDGTVAVVQKFPDGPPQTLWRAGQGSGNRTSAAVEGSYLTVQFQPSAAFARRHGLEAHWCYIAAALGLLVSLLLLLRFLPRNTPAPWERGKSKMERHKGEGKPDDPKPEPAQIRPPPEQREPLPQRAAAPSAREEPEAEAATKSRPPLGTDFPGHVFRAYDIRGIADSEINEPFAYQLGRALGTLALHADEKILLVGRDGRNSSELLSNCLIEGVLDSGCNSVNLGLVPSPLLYYACTRSKNTSSGVMVTASHNPADYNGFKIVLGGRPLAGDKLSGLHPLMQKGPFKSGQGSNREQDVRENYIEQIYNDVALAGQPHLVVDAGNGATSLLAPRLFEQLGCAVTPLFCEIDGNFPNHPPDPSRPENLQALIEKVAETGADLGVALDGDGDRVTLISSSGRIAWADQLVMLLARDILARNPGADVVFDVKSSRALGQLVNQYGGRPIMWKTGHAPMKTKMLETGALLGGELSGHIFIKDRWFGFDDGIYAAARILEIMALREQSLDELLDSLPQLVSTPEILLPVEEGEKFALIQQLKNTGDFDAADINTIDGLRIEYADGWGLVRASNTGAALTLRFEAESGEALERIRKRVMAELKKIDPELAVPDWQIV